jgi:hypothetical protein
LEPDASFAVNSTFNDVWFGGTRSVAFHRLTGSGGDMRPVLEIIFAAMIGLGLEAAMANNHVSEPPLELAAADLGLDGYLAPLDPFMAVKVAALERIATASGANAL